MVDPGRFQVGWHPALGFPWLLPIAALQFLLLDRVAIPREERILAETFGEDFAAYRASVHRWF